MTITIATVKENLENYTHGLPPQEWEFLYNELKTVKIMMPRCFKYFCAHHI